MLLGAQGLAAQGGHGVAVGGAPSTSTATVKPRSAAAGETVWIQATYLPPGTAVQFMMGALRDGFEVVSTQVTDDRGKLGGADSIAIKVPAWVTRDKPYLMIVTDAYYNPLGVADMFHPTDRNGVLVRTGKFVRETPACPSLIGESDEVYYLSGDTSSLQPGDRVRITGRALTTGPCGKGTTIAVQKLERVPSP
jgi:hypothetical protein